jgi:mannose-6-phosphate isomerase-like protein (cupin superfamily)
MVSDHVPPMSGMPAVVHNLLAPRDLSKLSSAERLEIARWLAVEFTLRGKRTPGMAPIGSRYGNPEDYNYIYPDIVEYCGGITERTKVCEVLYLGNDSSMDSLLVTTDATFVLEHVKRGSSETWPVIDGRARKARPATICVVTRGEGWLREKLEDGSVSLAQIARRFAHQVKGQREDIKLDLESADLQLANLNKLLGALAGY